MRVAALFDVHANVRALEAVLADGAADADVVVFGGDLVAGPWPRETLALARSLGERARFIRGNWERALLDGDERDEFVWLRGQLRDEELDWPATASLDGVFYCHATPDTDVGWVLPEWEASEWESFASVEEPVVACGHMHVQFDVERAGKRIVDVGSVGCPTIRAAAWWALFDAGSPELRVTEYDVERTVAEMRTSAFPSTEFADVLLDPWSVERLVAELAAIA